MQCFNKKTSENQKEKQYQAREKKLAIKDLINDEEAYSQNLAMEKRA